MLCPHCNEHVASLPKFIFGVGIKMTDPRCTRCGQPFRYGALYWVAFGVSVALGLAAGFWGYGQHSRGAWTTANLLVGFAVLCGVSIIIGSAIWFTLSAKPRR